MLVNEALSVYKHLSQPVCRIHFQNGPKLLSLLLTRLYSQNPPKTVLTKLSWRLSPQEAVCRAHFTINAMTWAWLMQAEEFAVCLGLPIRRRYMFICMLRCSTSRCMLLVSYFTIILILTLIESNFILCTLSAMYQNTVGNEVILECFNRNTTFYKFWDMNIFWDPEFHSCACTTRLI